MVSHARVFATRLGKQRTKAASEKSDCMEQIRRWGRIQCESSIPWMSSLGRSPALDIRLESRTGTLQITLGIKSFNRSFYINVDEYLQISFPH